MRVKEILKEKGMTQKELAKKIGIMEMSLSRSISGNPSLETMRKIAGALGVDVRELLAPSGEVAVKCPKCGTTIKLHVEDGSAEQE